MLEASLVVAVTVQVLLPALALSIYTTASSATSSNADVTTSGYVITLPFGMLFWDVWFGFEW